MNTGEPHRVGRPLDVASAAARAAQAAALSDGLSLRALSALAAGVPATELPEVLDASRRDVALALASLERVGIVRHGEGEGYDLTGEAWVRFGRLLVETPRVGGLRAIDVPVVALPDGIASVARDLSYRFSATFSAETVGRYVVESYLLLSQRAHVRTHLAALTAKYAADRLDALAAAQGMTLRGTPEVLFVCVQNAGRSQIAAAYLRHLAGGAVHVRTAGSEPAAAVNPRVLEALAEVGVPLSDDFPKPLTDEVVQAADYVITMGCGDACPVYPGRRYMDWDLADPVILDDAGLRAVRDEIRVLVEGLLVEIGVAAQPITR
ncbi:Protein-tyrosine-phosphatase [Microbacterium saccharophilum]|uniref:Protein-tyrosine-phosphatase n=1 Tax=Microbacterium saccharophilum TaxID=1213358 RepID=A0A7Z7D205_9MICO|nr:Protein-tyrosine-phosphatase [Microbacterium saccharophilum]